MDVLSIARVGILVLVSGAALPAFGEASGPDFFQVVGVAPDDQLNIRAEPNAGAARVGAIPPGSDGVRNLGCRGGLDYAEWAEATPAEREAAGRQRWCRVAWDGVEGWVAARYLAEGSRPAPTPGGGGEVPAAPKDGGPRLWEVKNVSGGLELRETPSSGARILARHAAGALLTNLGCRRGEDRVWCDVQELGGGPRGYVVAECLTPAISPHGAVATGADDSALRAGQGDFDARGFIPCAQHRGQTMHECEFAVARAGGGWATVVVTPGWGRPRTIFFANGQPIGADTSEADNPGEFKAWRENGLHFIRVGDERYEIPDAIPLGG